MKKIISLFAVLVLLLSLSACSSAPKEKVFSKNGLEITLTTDFTENTMEGYTVCYDSSHAAIFALKEDFSLMEGLEDMTLNEYGELARESNSSRSPSSLSTADGITYFEYSFFNESENVTYRYYTTVHKGSDAFWMVQFVCPDSTYATQKPNFVTWAKSVTVS